MARFIGKAQQRRPSKFGAELHQSIAFRNSPVFFNNNITCLYGSALPLRRSNPHRCQPYSPHAQALYWLLCTIKSQCFDPHFFFFFFFSVCISPWLSFFFFCKSNFRFTKLYNITPMWWHLHLHGCPRG